MKLWCVGKWTEPQPWEFVGVFDDEQRAIDACTTSQHFVAPCEMNVSAPVERAEWPGAYYPRADA